MFLTLSAPTIAQEKPIDEMFRVLSIDKQMEGGFEAMLPALDQMAARFKLNAEGKAELKEIFRTWFNEDIDRNNMINQIKKIYSDSFTDDEMRKVTAFYQTPVGKKFLEKSTTLMQLGAQIGMKEAQSKQAKLMERVKPFFDKHSIK